ncbi:MAG: hypothetical protein GX307_03215 [Euryarchaeota archaeon]|nr:hypothetical protein [Euryarchaeota archaeon]
MKLEEGTKEPTHWWSRLDGKLRRLSPHRKILFLVLLTLVVYGGLNALNGLIIHSLLEMKFNTFPDLPIFQERSKLLLNGGMIYRDVPFDSFRVESPPLINFFFIPPQLAGGAWWVYNLYFSTFVFFSSLMTYLVLRHWDEHLAFLASIVLLVCPFIVVDTTIGVQDEAIVGFFFIVPVLLFLRGNLKGTTAGLTVGFWTKFLSIILFPVMLLKMQTWRERFLHIGLAVLLSIIIALPFLMICPVEFLLFPSYYLLGIDDGISGTDDCGAGMSAVGLLSSVGVMVPGWAGGLATIFALLAAYWFCWKHELDAWRSCLLVTVVFLMVYPMIRLTYFFFPFAFLTVWAVEDKYIAARIFGIYIPLLLAQGIDVMIDDGTMPAYSAWLALIFLLIGLGILADTTRIALKKECFLDRPSEKASPI